jgi:hypothetical protein
VGWGVGKTVGGTIFICLIVSNPHLDRCSLLLTRETTLLKSSKFLRLTPSNGYRSKKGMTLFSRVGTRFQH